MSSIMDSLANTRAKSPGRADCWFVEASRLFAPRGYSQPELSGFRRYKLPPPPAPFKNPGVVGVRPIWLDASRGFPSDAVQGKLRSMKSRRSLALSINAGADCGVLAGPWIPGVFVLAHPLHANRFFPQRVTSAPRPPPCHHTRGVRSSQPSGTRGGHFRRNVQHLGNGIPRPEWPLRTGPDSCSVSADIRDSARRAHHAMQLERPVIGGFHTLCACEKAASRFPGSLQHCP